MSALVDLLEDCQPADLDKVVPVIQRLHAWLGEAAFAGCDKPGFAARLLALADDPRFDAERKLTLAGDLVLLSRACGLPISDADRARLGPLARQSLGALAGEARHKGAPPEPSVMRRHTVFADGLADHRSAAARGLVGYLAALAADPDNEIIDVWVRGGVSDGFGTLVAEGMGPAGRRARFFALDRQPDYLARLIEQGPRTSHFWGVDPLTIDLSLFALIGPTIAYAPGEAPPLQYADVYWSAREAARAKPAWRRRGAPKAFVANYRQAAALPWPAAAAAPDDRTGRAALGLEDGDLVIATAGERLALDFDQAFVDGMGGFLVADPTRRWLVAGPLPDFWTSALGQVLGRQFVHAPAPENLTALLAAADIYTEPFRAGDGEAAQAAIAVGAAVLTLGEPGDAAAFVPEAHRAADADDYFARLEALATDAGLRRAWAADQHVLAARRGDPDAFAAELNAMIRLAYKRCRARHPSSLEGLLDLPPQSLAALRPQGRA
ncbi:MAG: hypothetical protein WCY15_00745 [Phenylobacterium sp.]|uniref:hypothetical protein n=1 Tax=Phenylobacterium sp. TaxID=1871053 RepID=UPI003560936E